MDISVDVNFGIKVIGYCTNTISFPRVPNATDKVNDMTRLWRMT